MIAKDVTHVSFSALTDAEIIATSVCEVTNPSLAFTQDRASLGTLFDPRMGSTSALERCVTCGSAVDKCNGHSGHHHIALPMPHPFQLEPLFRALRSSCYFCYAACAAGCCPDCGRKQGKWHRDAVGRPLGQRTRYFHKHNLLTQRMVFFTPLEARAFIAKRPECRAMFIHTLCVLPPCARPSRRSAAGWTHAPLSRAYAAIVRESNNLTLFVSQCLARHVVLAQATRLAHAIGILFDTSKCKDERSQGLRQRLDGKQGRFRQNLLGQSRARTPQTGGTISLVVPTNTRSFVRQESGLLGAHSHHSRPVARARPGGRADLDGNEAHRPGVRDATKHRRDAPCRPQGPRGARRRAVRAPQRRRAV